MVKKNIVILGAGFAGLRCAQDLSRKKLGKEYQLYLLDKRDRHLFRADLYEVATAFDYSGDLSWTIATPVRSLIDEKQVRFLCDEVLKVDRRGKQVVLAQGEALKYEYLVVALGTESNDYGILGLKDFAYPMKELDDALRFNRDLSLFFGGLSKNKNVRDVHLSIGGGGPTGVEIAGELSRALNKICEKHKYPRKKVHVRLIEGLNRLAMQDASGTSLVKQRLKKLGINVQMKTFIQELHKDKILVKDARGSRFLDNDFLIWTGGVKVSPLVSRDLGDKKFHGAVPVNGFLQMENNKKIFAAGDNAFVIGHNFPMLAWVAYQQGALIADNIAASIAGRELKHFKPTMFGMIIPIGGKYAVVKWGKVFYAGFFAWLLKRLVYLRYALSIMPVSMALKKWWRSSVVFERND